MPRPALHCSIKAFGLFAYPITGPLLALIVIIVVFSLTTSTFMNGGNLSLIAQQSVVIGTLALGQTLIILVSGIDLADGAIMVLGTVVAGSYASHGDPVVALLLAFVVCVAVASSTASSSPDFDCPLSSQPWACTRSSPLGRGCTRSRAAFRSCQTSSPARVRAGFWRGHGNLRQHAVGRADLDSRLRVERDRLGRPRLRNRQFAHRRETQRASMSRASSSASMHWPEFSTAFAAWQALGRTPIADPSGYQIANLDSITAVVIGGTSLFGGRGGVAGTFVGTLIVVALKNGLTQAGIDSLYQQIATGALVMLAVGVDQYLGRGQRV